VNALAKGSWSPYAVGAGIGALSCFSFVTAEKPLGITTPFESTAAALEQALAPRVTGVNAYLAKREEVPKLDHEWALCVGVLAGSYLSARAAGVRATRAVPVGWRRRFGPSVAKRYAGAFLGGALMMFGARMAKGCTSGHAISGVMQMAGSSWLFAPIMATTAALASRALFPKGAR